MATVTQQEVSPLHKHLNITIAKEDYLPSFEKSLKDYSKKANIPGFRKGMVPTGLIRKMYGNSLFVDEVLRTVDKQVSDYIQNEKLEIFAQPLPVEFNVTQLDVNKPDNYSFTFEVGMKPDFQLPDLAKESVKRYKVEVTDEMLAKMFELNVGAVLRLIRLTVPKMIERGTGGSIINIASIAGLRPQPGGLLYSATKAALIMMTRTWALEFGKHKVRVNSIAPGLIQTDFSEYFWKNENYVKQLEATQPIPRVGTPDEIGGMALYLASDESSFVTGQNFVVDGGATAR